MVKFYLYLNSLMYFVFALWCAAEPHWTAEAVGFTLLGNKGLSEYTAVYGGLQFGVALFYLLTAIRRELNSIGILFSVCFYTSLALFRSYSIIVHGSDIGSAMNFYIAEVTLAGLAIFLSIRLRKAS